MLFPNWGGSFRALHSTQHSAALTDSCRLLSCCRADKLARPTGHETQQAEQSSNRKDLDCQVIMCLIGNVDVLAGYGGQVELCNTA
jgi:hypothetical protein